MTTHNITTTRINCDGTRSADDVLVYQCRRFGIGFIPQGCEERQVIQGPMVPGPWAYCYGLCTVIDNHGGTGSEMRSLEERGLVHHIERDDIVVVDGTRHLVEATRNGYPSLTVLEEDPEDDEPVYDDYGPDESMDGDHRSALASCGWGTDEDYGCFDGDDW